MEAFLVFPVPSAAASIRGVLCRCQDTSSVDQVVSKIARNTVSEEIESVALVGNRDTGSKFVENPVIGALQTFLVLPVPSSAAII